MNRDPYVTPYAKINLKTIINLNVKPQTLKTARKNIGENLLISR